jgi:hypothetical protein
MLNFSPVGEQELQHHDAKVEEFAKNKSAEVDVVPENKKCFLISVTSMFIEVRHTRKKFWYKKRSFGQLLTWIRGSGFKS